MLALQPTAAMLQAAVFIRRAAAAAHQEHLHACLRRWRPGLEGLLEPLQAATQPILRHLAVKGRLGTELDITAVADIAVAVQPRAHDQLLRCAAVSVEGGVVGQGRADISVVPTGHEQHWDIR